MVPGGPDLELVGAIREVVVMFAATRARQRMKVSGGALQLIKTPIDGCTFRRVLVLQGCLELDEADPRLSIDLSDEEPIRVPLAGLPPRRAAPGTRADFGVDEHVRRDRLIVFDDQRLLGLGIADLHDPDAPPGLIVHDGGRCTVI